MHLTKLLIGLGLLVTATSCTVGSQGLFASIEREQKVQSEGTMNVYATITHMAELNTGSALDQYIACGGAYIFSRPASGGNWNNGPLNGQKNVTAVGVAGGLYSTNNANTGARAYAVAGNQLFESLDGSTWTLSSFASSLATGDIPFDLIPIRQGDGITTTDLLLVTEQAIPNTSNPVLYSYSDVYVIKGGTGNASPTLSGQIVLSIPAAPGLTDPTSQIWAPIAAVDDGTNYYILNDTNLWQLGYNYTTLKPVNLALSPTGTMLFGGMIYLNNGTSSTVATPPANSTGFYFTTWSNGLTAGALYWIPGDSLTTATLPTDTANTLTIVPGSQQTFGSYPAALGPMIYNKVNQTLWVGTLNSVSRQGDGYGEVTLGSSPSMSANATCFNLTTDMNNYESTVLITTIAYSFFYGNGIYFLGTGAQGLWTWSNQEWSQQ